MLTRTDIVDELRMLGVQIGDALMVHSSMTALGDVEGGPETVINALVEAVGISGLVAVPTFCTQSPFDRRVSSTSLGAIPELFWRRPEAKRSLHPTHSVAAIGRGAEELLKGHELAATAYGEGTPYYNLAMQGGKVLLMGVDQDRNTTLHTAEALSNAQYLKDIEGVYIDDDGNEVTISVAAMAGPHRDFIGLDKLLHERGAMVTGLVGNAVCRLMPGNKMLEVVLDALRHDPAAVLCGNPACADCVTQRGMIKAARLRDEKFTLAAVATEISDNLNIILDTIQSEGISALELTLEEYKRWNKELTASGVRVAAIRAPEPDKKAHDAAVKAGAPLIAPVKNKDDFKAATKLNNPSGRMLVENNGISSSALSELYEKTKDAPGLAFNPARFAAVGEHPFLEVFYRGVIRKNTSYVYAGDGTFDGTLTTPGMGNGEVKEIVSMLRCRSYNGVISIRSASSGVQAFREAAKAFWLLLDTM